MEGAGRLYLDSNIFIRAFEADDELSTSLSELLLAGGGASRPHLVTSELTLAELLVIPYREKNEPLIESYDGWIASGEYLEVAPINRSVLYFAAVLRAQYKALKLADAIHLSTAIGLQCSHMLSADRDFAARYELTNERWGPKAGPVTIHLLRPEIAILRQVTDTLQKR